MRRFLKVTWWEFVQNLPLVTGFVTSLYLWQKGLWAAAIACAIAGSVAGALLIGATESKIVESHQEPIGVIVVNIVTITILTFVSVIYLSASWSNWKTDIFIGAVAGITLGVAQSLMAGESIGLRHCVALACSTPLVLVGLRLLVATLPALANILIITVAITLIVVLIDYGPFPAKEQQSVPARLVEGEK